MSITIISPANYAIYQRNPMNSAAIKVRGSADGNIKRVEARLLISSSETPITNWQQMNVDSGYFEGEIIAPAGGWYLLQIKGLGENGITLAESCVEKVGVGEVFVCSGQSNSANHGTAKMKSEDDRVACFDGKEWRHCSDPLRPATGEGGSPWPVLGDLLVRQLDMPVGFISVGFGGKSVNFWQPGQQGHIMLKNALKALGPNGAKAVLWHQGETDASNGMPSIDYEVKLANAIRQSKADAGYDIQWFVANASFVDKHWDEHPEQRDAIRLAQQTLWKMKIANQGPDTDALRHPKYRSEDRVHFSEYGLRAHAERWFAMLWAQLFEGK